jgi:endonuclease/exonuclease/phosphatase family metal-dependent hydrolase
VLLGDLNMPPPFPRALTRWQVLARTHTYPAWEPKIQLDHVLGSGALPAVLAVEAPRLAVSTTARCWWSWPARSLPP